MRWISKKARLQAKRTEVEVEEPFEVPHISTFNQAVKVGKLLKKDVRKNVEPLRITDLEF